jgi:hypothetical protein
MSSELCQPGSVTKKNIRPLTQADATALKVVEAVRELLLTFRVADSVIGPSNSSGETPSSTVKELLESPTGSAQYSSLSLLAATIRWASSETGRDELEILEELAKSLDPAEYHNRSKVSRDAGA